jgi:hypothetical protein
MNLDINYLVATIGSLHLTIAELRGQIAELTTPKDPNESQAESGTPGRDATDSPTDHK